MTDDTVDAIDIRPMEPADVDAVRRIARASLSASYSPLLAAETIESAVDEWYSPEAFDDYLDADEMLFLVATADGEVVGFSQSHVVEEIDKGRILWLHVDPAHRGHGVATGLFDRTREALRDRGISRITGLVLSGNEDGNRFYDEHGFELLYDRTIEIAGATHDENVYGEPGIEVDELEPAETADGREVFVDPDEWSRGTEDLFYAAYSAPDRTERYGWFCTACESTDNAMDAMGRIVCNRCGNRRKATRWDASYL